MKVTKVIVVLRNNQPDSIALYVGYSDPSYPEQELSLDMKAPINSGVKWVKDNLNIDPEIVDARIQSIPFSR